jgi:hypothetical protein
MASEWEVVLDGTVIATRSSKQAAMNFLDKPRRVGRAEVRNARTHESFHRRGGGWYRGDTHVASNVAKGAK